MPKPVPIRCSEILKAVNAPSICCDACHDSENDEPGKSITTQIGKYITRLCCYGMYYLHHERDLEAQLDQFVYPGKHRG